MSRRPSFILMQLLLVIALLGCGRQVDPVPSAPDMAVAPPASDAGVMPPTQDGAVLPPATDATVVPPPPPPGPEVEGKPAQLDLLFVVDNSGSMADEQQKLARAVPALLRSLRDPAYGPDGSGRPCTADDTSGCSTPDLHIGVVSTDLGAGEFDIPSCERAGGDGGALETYAGPGLTLPTTGVIHFDGSSTNVVGAEPDATLRVESALSRLVSLGIAGCGFEQPLEAARRALDPGLQKNPAFGRTSAALAIVFVTDEDDCSARDTSLYDPNQQSLSDPLGPLSSFRCFEFGVRCDINDRNVAGPRSNCQPAGDYLHPVQDYQAFFKGLRAPGWVHVAVISGPTDPVAVGKEGPNPTLLPSCQSSVGFAVPAIRLQAALDVGSKVTGSICNQSFDTTLVRLAQTVLR